METTEPENCRLTAHHTGDGWLLSVVDSGGETIAYLAWPGSWPEIITTSKLIDMGFEIV